MSWTVSLGYRTTIRFRFLFSSSRTQDPASLLLRSLLAFYGWIVNGAFREASGRFLPPVRWLQEKTWGGDGSFVQTGRPFFLPMSISGIEVRRVEVLIMPQTPGMIVKGEPAVHYVFSRTALEGLFNLLMPPRKTSGLHRRAPRDLLDQASV